MLKNLNPLAFTPLPAKALRSEGWLLRQLQIQAAGQAGNLDKYWADVKDSGWIGGNAESWERAPYWLDGFVPLAYLLRDDDMIKRANYYIDYILTHQQEDGWICPEKDKYTYDMWALFIILKVLVQYYHFTDDSRVEPAVTKALLNIDRRLDIMHTLFAWGNPRGFYPCFISANPSFL